MNDAGSAYRGFKSLEPIKQLASRPFRWLQSIGRRHPRRLSATLLASLGGFAAAAFGIAPLAPDAAAIPQRQIVESVAVPGLEAQVEGLAVHDLALWRSDITRHSDTVGSLLLRLGVSDPSLASFIRSDPAARRLIEGRAGKMVQAVTAADGTLQELVARYPAADEAQLRTHFTRLTLSRANGRLFSRLEIAPLTTQLRLGSGAIRSSLFAATDEAGLPDSIAAQLIEIFSTEIDFHRELRKGDSFSVAFEGLNADGHAITWNEGTGRVLAAEFTNNRRHSQAVWFNDPATGKGGYFGADGRGKRRAFLASPLAFSRVTSTFAMRLHPILQSWRAHNGVDYAAPSGTAVHAVGDGVVDKAGWQNGYGLVVALKHSGDKATVYAHLSQIDVRPGQRIVQGQQVGLVGATGWATGPHLHFELRVGGEFQDPLVMARQADTAAIDTASMPRFQSLALSAQARLMAAETMRGYRGGSE